MSNNTEDLKNYKYDATKQYERLSYFVKLRGDSFRALTMKIGVSNAYFSTMKITKCLMTVEIIAKILLYYRDLSPDWLIFGNGTMLRGSTMKEEQIYGVKNAKQKELLQALDQTEKQIKEFRKVIAK